MSYKNNLRLTFWISKTLLWDWFCDSQLASSQITAHPNCMESFKGLKICQCDSFISWRGVQIHKCMSLQFLKDLHFLQLIFGEGFEKLKTNSVCSNCGDFSHGSATLTSRVDKMQLSAENLWCLVEFLFFFSQLMLLNWNHLTTHLTLLPSCPGVKHNAKWTAAKNLCM